MIRVMYKNGIHDTATADYLDYLLATDKIRKFKRSSGWATIGLDQIRKAEAPKAYDGQERRASPEN